MKKIIYTLLVALMAFSFMGCPTIEVMEPELPANASWYYIDIPADAKNVIFNDGTNQTADIKGIDVSSGSIYYAWNSALAKDNPDHSFVFEPTDKPEGKAGRVWCYSSVVPNCYWWDCASEADNATWPGKPMTENGKTVAVEYKSTMQIASITVTNVPAEYQSLEMYAIGDLVGGWTFESSNKGSMSGSTFTVTYSTPLTVTTTSTEQGKIMSLPFKVATDGWKNAITTEDAADGNVDISVLNGKKVAILGTANTTGNYSSEDEYKRVGCVWSIKILGDIE